MVVLRLKGVRKDSDFLFECQVDDRSRGRKINTTVTVNTTTIGCE